MIDVSTFDPLPVEAIWAVFTLPAQEPYSESFDASGYSYLYAVENFGTGTLTIHLCIISAVVVLILTRINTSVSNHIIKHPKFIKFKNGLFFGGTLRFLFEGYLELTASVCIGLLTMNWSETSSFSIMYCNFFTVLIGIALIALPFYILVYYFRNIQTLDDEEFQERLGTLLDDLKLDSTEDEKPEDLLFKRKMSVLFPFFFVVRRLIFIGISIGLAPWPYFQLMGAFYLTTGMVIYLLWFWPFADNFLTKIEVMNEVT